MSGEAPLSRYRRALQRTILPFILFASLLASCAQNDSTPAAKQAADAAAITAAAPRTSTSPTDETPFPGARPRPQFVPGELLVKFKPGTAKTRSDSLLQRASVRFSRGYRSVPGLLRVSLSPETTVQAARAALEGQPDVEYAEPNYLYYPHATPNDTFFFTAQFDLHFLGNDQVPPDSDIDAPEAWDITTGSDDVVVAVLDTGIFGFHEDLAASVYRNEADCNADGVDDDANGYADDCNGIDAYENDSDPTDITIHGSHVAGIIGAATNNGIGIAGVAWHVRILPCRFIDFFNGGSAADAVECFDYVAMMKDRGVNIIATNNSWGAIYPSRAVSDAIGAQLARGILTIASAGNDSLDNDREPVYPCNTDHANVICVASSSFLHRVSDFSNYGDQTVHLSAPGEDVLSTTGSNGTINEYDYLTGTSMSAPLVTGVAVLLAAQDPTRDWRALKNLLLAGAEFIDETPRRTITGARLNAPGSLLCASRTITRRLKPEFRSHLVAGATVIPLRAMNIDCASPNGAIVVTVTPTGETIVLADDGAGDDEAAGDGIYNSHWTAPTAGGTYELRFQDPIGDIITVEVDPFLKPGFPLKGMDSGWFVGFWDGPGHQVMAGNIDDDPELEVLIPSVSAGPLFAYNYDGTPVPGFPIVDNGGQPYAALGEFDGDPTHAEIANNDLWTFGITLYRGDGQPMPGGWPHPGRMLVPPAAADLDGDGVDEVILYPAYRADGSVFNPVTRVPSWGPEGGGFPGSPSSVAVGDVDGDGLPEMVSARQMGIWMSNANDVAEGFPVLFGPTETNDSFQIIPVIGDIDADGVPEIIVATSIRGDTFYSCRVLVYSSRGVRKWMRTLSIPTQLSVAPVLADMDGDGVPEVIVQTMQYIHVWKGDGSELAGWPVFLGNDADSVQSSPVVGDIDGDGLPDLVTTARDTSAPYAGKTYIYHRDGRLHDGYPRQLLSYRMGMAAAIADIDLDGRNDLLIAPTSVPGVSDTLYGYDYNGGRPSGPIEWGQFMEGPENRGFYELGKNLPDDAFVAVFAHGAGTVTENGGGIDCGADCIEKVARGTHLQLHAHAGPGASFREWLGDCAGQANPCQLTVTGFTNLAASFDTPVVVNFAGSGSGRVTSAPAGIDCTTDCTQTFSSRTVVTLTATPGAGFGFDGWSGDCRNATGPCRLYIDSAKDVKALFNSSRSLTVTRSGTGSGTVQSLPAGIDCGATCSAEFAPETEVELTATAAPDSQFRGWTGGGCDNSDTLSCLVTMDAAKTVDTLFELKPLVTVDSNGGGRVTSSPAGIDCGSTCSSRFDFDEVVTLTATPDEGKRFDHWTGPCNDNHPVCTIIFPEGTVSVSAQFTGAPSITVFIEGGGQGKVTSIPSGINCGGRCTASFTEDSIVQLTAAPANGSAFRGWSGACTGTTFLCEVNLSASTTVSARFEIVNTPPGGGGGGSGGGGGAFDWFSLLALSLLAGCRPRDGVLPIRKNEGDCPLQ